MDKNMVKRIKRINERIADIGRTFGTESDVYKEYESRIVNMFPQDYHYSKKGFITLSHGKRVIHTTETDRRLLSLDVLPPRGKIVKRSKKRLKEKGIVKPTLQDVKEEVERKDRVIQLIDDNLDLAYTIDSKASNDFIDYMRGSKKDYDEIEEKINAFLADYESGQYELRDMVAELEKENGYIPKRKYRRR